MNEWIKQQLQRWRKGELEAKLEPSQFGDGESWVIEPKPGHKIVVGRSSKGKSIFSDSTSAINPKH